MKLLAKSDVAKAKAFERQRDIAEGVKLADRVDTLREVAAQEEASLEKFRRETVAAINQEILGLNNLKDTLTGEVKTLESRRERALEPLLEREKVVAATEEKAGLVEANIADRRMAVKAAEEDVQRRTEILERAEAQAGYTQLEARSQLEKAATIRSEAEQELQRANSIRITSETEASARQENILHRERWLEEREQAIFNKEEELRTKEIVLAEEYTRLKDREATLERDITRHGKR